ncbi:MAG: Fibronectin type domain protein [Gemmatimonadetes bacterium]|nr:Fibronectin type domain protein [Gemmatimonadota bacterium]
MRTMTTAEAAALAAPHRATHVRLLMEDASGVFADLTGWLEEVGTQVMLDDAVESARLRLRYRAGGDAINPLITSAPSNNPGGSYAPAVDTGREVRIEVATMLPGATPAGGDWRLIFHGEVDDVDPAAGALSLRDLGGALMDAQVEAVDPHYSEAVGGNVVEPTYGSAAGEPAEAVLQAILGSVPLGVPVTLYTPTSPGVNLRTFTGGSGSVWELARSTALKFGWEVRYWYDQGTASYRPTLMQVDRERAVPDWTIPAGMVMGVARLKIGRSDIRNVIRVDYLENGYFADKLIVTNLASISKYGRRYARIVLGTDSPVRSRDAARTLATTVLSDLSEPLADMEVEVAFHWAVQIGDLIRFTACRFFDTDQDLAVMGVRHTLSGSKRSTTLTVSGKPRGAYWGWLALTTQIAGANALQPSETAWALTQVSVRERSNTTATLGWRRGAAVAYVLVWDLLVSYPVTGDPSPPSGAPPTVTLYAGSDTYVASVPPRGYTRCIWLQPLGADLRPGRVWPVTLDPTQAEPPTYVTYSVRTGTVETMYLKYEEHGIPVLSVEAQTQTGAGPLSAWAPPTRGPGDASVYTGAAMGAGEVEVDVALDGALVSRATIRLTCDGIEPITEGPIFFSSDGLPRIVSAAAVGTRIILNGSSAVQSWRLAGPGGAWLYEFDGRGGTVDVAQTGTNAHAGIGATETWSVAIEARPVPLAAVGVSTPRDYGTVLVQGASAGSEPYWSRSLVTAPALASSVVSLSLEASGAPVGYTAHVFERLDDGGGYGSFADITAALGITAPPTTYTTYTRNVGTPMRAAAAGRTVRAQYRCEIWTGASVPVATQTVTATWYAAGGA